MKSTNSKQKTLETIVIVAMIIIGVLAMKSGKGTLVNPQKMANKKSMAKTKKNLVKKKQSSQWKKNKSKNNNVPKALAKKYQSSPKQKKIVKTEKKQVPPAKKPLHSPEDYDEDGNLRAPTIDEFMNGE